MAGEENLEKLLKNMSPELDYQEYVFITSQNSLAEMIKLNPLCSFVEEEGLTLIIKKCVAMEHGLEFDDIFRKITLRVRSSLNAVGLTAVVASKLKDNNISCNVVAAYYHDHIFIQSELSEKALSCLEDLTR